jgi:hypothetical protein
MPICMTRYILLCTLMIDCVWEMTRL